MFVQRALKLCQTVDQIPREGCGVAACVHGLAWRKMAGGVNDVPNHSLQTPTNNKRLQRGGGWHRHLKLAGEARSSERE